MNSVPPQKDDNDFHVDLTFSGQEKNYLRPTAIVVAAVGVIFIIATMTTSVAEYLLPMDDRYLQVLIPVAADGGEALALRSLEQEIMDKTITVRGTVANRTDYPVSSILAVVDMQETTGRFNQVIDAPVDPAELPSQATGSFMATATLQEKPAGYIVKFKLADGPFVPHKDERGALLSIPPVK